MLHLITLKGAHARTHTHTHTQSRNPLDEGSARRRLLTTHNTHNRHPCLLWNSNPESQQARDRRPTP